MSPIVAIGRLRIATRHGRVYGGKPNSYRQSVLKIGSISALV
jgi:hypothetical protein